MLPPVVTCVHAVDQVTERNSLPIIIMHTILLLGASIIIIGESLLRLVLIKGEVGRLTFDAGELSFVVDAQ